MMMMTETLMNMVMLMMVVDIDHLCEALLVKFG